MSRKGLDDLLQWAGQHQVDVRDFCVRLTLRNHPRNQGSGNNRTSLLVAQPGAVAGDGSAEYRQALEQAAELLAYAEAAWLASQPDYPSAPPYDYDFEPPADD